MVYKFFLEWIISISRNAYLTHNQFAMELLQEQQQAQCKKEAALKYLLVVTP